MASPVQQVIDAIREDSVEQLRATLPGVDLRTRDPDGTSLAQQAIRFGSPAALGLLLDRGAPLEPDLQMAAAIVCGDVDRVRALLRTTDLDRVDRMGQTPLVVAVRSSDLELIELLLDSGADTEVRHQWHGNILETAAERPDPRVVELLLRAGANVHAKNGSGGTPLIAMLSPVIENVSPQRVECARLLVRAGARLHYRYNDHHRGWVDKCALCNVAGSYGGFSDGHAAALHVLLDAGGPRLLDARGADALCAAIASGYGRAVEILLWAGVSPNGADEDGHTTLLCAVRSGRVDILSTLLRAGARVPAMSHGGRALLLEARAMEDPRFAALLDPYDVPGEYAASPNGLKDAIDAGDLVAVERLLDGGLDAGAELPRAGGTAAVSVAARNGRADIVRALVARGADLEASGGWGRPLEVAVEEHHLECVRTLIELGCDVNAEPRSLKMHGPLWYAAQTCELEIVRLLLAAGADPYLDMARRTWPNKISRKHSYEETMDALLFAMRDPIRRRTTLQLALYSAVYDQALREVRYFLERAPELRSGPDDVRPELIQGAANRGNVDMLRCLLSFGPCSLERGDMTPLMNAVLAGHLEAVRVLVEAGASVRARGRGGFTPLMYACYRMRSEYPAIVEYLLDRGVEIDACSADGRTALMLAAQSGPYGVVSALFRRGANLFVRDHKGRTAFDLAAQRGDANVLDLLRASTTGSKR